jgi:pimeloyl-ACP methyl ester carboxylesterase
MRDHGTLERSVHRIAVPVRVLHGALDIVVAPSAADALAGELGVSVELLDQVGHLLLHQAPQRVAEVICELAAPSA